MRVRSLDGLRGLAAAVVAVHHALLCLAPLSLVYLEPDKVAKGSRTWWFGFTPLHAVWAGGEAVYLFFVLSGLVLARPWIDRRAGTWFAYYLKRVPRLYLPATASVVVALATIWMVKRISVGDVSGWLASHPAKITRPHIVDDLSLIRAPAGWTHSPLWSLRWEVVFSLSLPVWVALGSIVRKWRMQAFGLAVALYLTVVPFRETDWTAYRHYMAIFFVGVTLANTRRIVPPFLARVLRAKFAALWAAVAFVVLATWRWTRPGLGLNGPSAWHTYIVAFDQLTVLAAAILAIVLSVGSSPWRRVLESPPLQYLGSRSYSLYLVHEPVVVAYAYSRHGHPTFSGLFFIALPLAALLSEVFYRVVERPSIRCARWLGARAPRRPQSNVLGEEVAVGGGGAEEQFG
jgi:peptidoglycan/LPS O-acetylase OafA/YrhL